MKYKPKLINFKSEKLDVLGEKKYLLTRLTIVVIWNICQIWANAAWLAHLSLSKARMLYTDPSVCEGGIQS